MNINHLKSPIATTKTRKGPVAVSTKVWEKKRPAPAKFKKAPGAPRRFKSAFIFFSTQKHKEIRSSMGKAGEKEKTTNVAKMVSGAWKSLPTDEREYWEEKARKDKERYELEKSLYNGPWKVPVEKLSKDPNAPKRPMSAFLAYSNSKRSQVRKENPKLSNAEISRILANMWKVADEDDKKVYIDTEFKLRQDYKLAMTEWKANAERQKEAEREHREQLTRNTVQARKQQLLQDEASSIRYHQLYHDQQFGGFQQGAEPDGTPGFNTGASRVASLLSAARPQLQPHDDDVSHHEMALSGYERPYFGTPSLANAMSMYGPSMYGGHGVNPYHGGYNSYPAPASADERLHYAYDHRRGRPLSSTRNHQQSMSMTGGGFGDGDADDEEDTSLSNGNFHHQHDYSPAIYDYSYNDDRRHERDRDSPNTDINNTGHY